MIITLIIGISGGILCGVFTNLAAQNYGNDLRKDTFNHIINLSYEQTDEFSTGSLVTRLTNDITQVDMIIGLGLQMMVKAPIMAVWAILKILNKGFEWSILTGVCVVILMTTVILLMIIGRLGPITISIALFKKHKEAKQSKAQYPYGNILIG